MMAGAAARALFMVAVFAAVEASAPSAPAATAAAVATAAAPARIVFRNDLPEVRIQDPEAGIYYVKISIYADGPVDGATGVPDGKMLKELQAIEYGAPIEGKDLPGRAVDISKKDLEKRKKDDPRTLIRPDKKGTRLLFDGTLPAGSAWMKVRYDTAIYRRGMKQGAALPGARNWVALALPVAPEDRWIKLQLPAEACAKTLLTITALVRGVHDDERDFTTSVESRCE